jgi:exodeoxyribonuclease VII small subunit
MATKSPASPPSEPAQTFETAMQRLERIVEEMESDQLPLESLLTRYEEGVKLVRVCDDKLKAAEQRIEIITRNAAGEPRIEEFESEKKTSTAPRQDVSLF